MPVTKDANHQNGVDLPPGCVALCFAFLAFFAARALGWDFKTAYTVAATIIGAFLLERFVSLFLSPFVSQFVPDLWWAYLRVKAWSGFSRSWDESLLTRVTQHHRRASVRTRAVGMVSNPQYLAQVAMRLKPQSLGECITVYRGYEDSPARKPLRYDYRSDDAYADACRTLIEEDLAAPLAAVEKLADEELLATIASCALLSWRGSYTYQLLGDGHPRRGRTLRQTFRDNRDIQEAALAKVRDTALLARIAREANDTTVRQCALERAALYVKKE